MMSKASLLFLSVWLFACDSNQTNGKADTSGEVTDTTTEDATATASCFHESQASSGDCDQLCQPFASCVFPVANYCRNMCLVSPSKIHRCGEAGTDCKAFEHCINCANVCDHADSCSPPLSPAACCEGCIQRPACMNFDLMACDAIAGCI